ncbi:uncharacterized protein LOC126056415 [Helicoverpa armigera]|uniref:uncharacterized protein LOC126056415 n=1 Tax=Helicoverpa armigera TaxID=29058 RepID=UPI0030828577
MLCSKHFKSTCFNEKKLFRTAVPDVQCQKDTTTSNVPDQSAIFEPVAGPSRMNPLTEHNVNIITPTNSGMFVCKSSKQESDQKSKMLRKLKSSMNKVYRLQKTVKHLKNESFLNVICNNETVREILNTKMSSTFALLLQGELQNYKRKKPGRRWNMEAKIIALRLYKRSPTSYKLLRRMICLPAPSTLKSLLSKFKMNVGTHKTILTILKNTTKHFVPSEREYILLWDEMSLRKNLWYNSKTDLIEGFQDHATQGRSPQPASYALVFMIVGVRKHFKQPVAYYLSSGSVTADRLSALIKEVLNCCFDAGINICASVCDLDGVNKRALCQLGASVENPFIEVSNHKIVTLFDTPHLLKCFRNLFMKYHVRFRTNITSDHQQGIGVAKWSHIKQFYELDNNNPNFVFAPCLSKQHLEPNSKQKMRVKLAAQVLSHSVAAGLYTKIAGGDMPTEALATANLISSMDDLFDGVNASTPDLRRGKIFSTNIKHNTGHLQMFDKMKFFKTLEFLGCRGNPPSKDGWIWTLNGLEMVWKILSAKHTTVKSLSTRRFQQDPLENLFGCIRFNCGSNSNPTVAQFVAGLKTAVISNMAHTSSGNCELDSNSAIITNFKKLLTPATDMHTETEQSESVIENEIEENIISSLEQNLEEGSSELQACAYVCGFIIKNIKIFVRTVKIF